MKIKRHLVVGTLWVIALLALVVWYRRTPRKEFGGAPLSPAVMHPQPMSAQKKVDEDTASEKKRAELETKQIEELKASLERANRDGSVSRTTPIPPLPPKGTNTPK